MKGILIIAKNGGNVRVLHGGAKNYVIADIDSGIIITDFAVKKDHIIMMIERLLNKRRQKSLRESEILYVH